MKTVHDLGEGCRGARAVYARSWGSLECYGQPSVEAVKRSRHTGWIVDAARMRATAEGRLLHAMPVRRNVNVTDEVLDGPSSLVIPQAANRLHFQKALLAWLLIDNLAEAGGGPMVRTLS